MSLNNNNKAMQAYFIMFVVSILFQKKTNRSKLFEDKNGGIQGSMLMWADRITHRFPPHCFPEHHQLSFVQKHAYIISKRLSLIKKNFNS